MGSLRGTANAIASFSASDGCTGLPTFPVLGAHKAEENSRRGLGAAMPQIRAPLNAPGAQLGVGRLLLPCRMLGRWFSSELPLTPLQGSPYPPHLAHPNKCSLGFTAETANRGFEHSLWLHSWPLCLQNWRNSSDTILTTAGCPIRLLSANPECGMVSRNRKKGG